MGLSPFRMQSAIRLPPLRHLFGLSVGVGVVGRGRDRAAVVAAIRGAWLGLLSLAGRLRSGRSS